MFRVESILGSLFHFDGMKLMLDERAGVSAWTVARCKSVFPTPRPRKEKWHKVQSC